MSIYRAATGQMAAARSVVRAVSAATLFSEASRQIASSSVRIGTTLPWLRKAAEVVEPLDARERSDRAEGVTPSTVVLVTPSFVRPAA